MVDVVQVVLQRLRRFCGLFWRACLHVCFQLLILAGVLHARSCGLCSGAPGPGTGSAFRFRISLSTSPQNLLRLAFVPAGIFSSVPATSASGSWVRKNPWLFAPELIADLTGEKFSLFLPQNPHIGKDVGVIFMQNWHAAKFLPLLYPSGRQRRACDSGCCTDISEDDTVFRNNSQARSTSTTLRLMAHLCFKPMDFHPCTMCSLL